MRKAAANSPREQGDMRDDIPDVAPLIQAELAGKSEVRFSLSSTHLSRYDARVWGCGMWCRQFVGFGGVAAARLVAAARAARDIQKENNSFISAGASTS
jgi:hypothetical protein